MTYAPRASENMGQNDGCKEHAWALCTAIPIEAL